jgi:hypothetical protein
MVHLQLESTTTHKYTVAYNNIPERALEYHPCPFYCKREC